MRDPMTITVYRFGGLQGAGMSFDSMGRMDTSNPAGTVYAYATCAAPLREEGA